jgi:hypothetical protein
MNAKFQKSIEKFPRYMTKLTKLSPVQPSGLKNIPKRGIYVFYEDNKPIYVGRSRNLTQRFRQHRQQSSDQHSATFAFMIARQDAEKKGVNVNKTREELQKDRDFLPFFINAKKRVSEMQVKVIRIDNPVKQTLFEVYAALELKTPYNNWDTH